MLDVLRAVATIRVVLYHASGDSRWSWFAAIPVMSFVGGALYAASLDRRPPLHALGQRLRRIVIPLWAHRALQPASAPPIAEPSCTERHRC